MPVFRLAIYFAALFACAVAAFPAWAPDSADADAPPATAPSSILVAHKVAYKKAAAVRRPAASTRMASRD